MGVRRNIEKIPAIDEVRRPGIVRLAAMRLAALVALLALGAAALPALGSAASPGQLYAFGENYAGELGNPNVNDEPQPNPALVTLPGEAGPVTQAAAGGGFSLAVTSSGQLYAFGENVYGQLGNETNLKNIFAANPTPALVNLPGATGPVIQAAGGEFFSLAVTSTGQLYAFGSNFSGELGTKTNYRTDAPNPTPALVTLPGATGPVTEVAAGGRHSLALTSTGQLYAFGSDIEGQLGMPPSGLLSDPTPTLVSLPGATGPVSAIAAGAYFSLAATSSGQLYAFGENVYGQLGNPTNDLTDEPNPTPTLVTLPGEVGPVIQVAAGQDHSLALTASGQLYAFGMNAYGQLGIPAGPEYPTIEAHPTPTLVHLPSAAGRIIRIAAGMDYSLALTASGQLYAFGSDYNGELGFWPGEHEERGKPHSTPIPVALPGGNAETMATGCWSDQTLVVLADLAVTSRSLPAGEIGLPYSAQAQGTGGAAPYTWSANGLPPGLSIDPESGAISGTPTAAGTYTATITATDGNGIEAPTPLTLKIKGPNEPPPGEPPPPPPNEPPPLSIPPLPSVPQQPLLPSQPSETSPPPSVQNTRQSANRWHEGNPLAHRGHTQTPAGTTFSFSLNEPATVSLSFIQLPGGGRSGHGCLAAAHAKMEDKSCGHTVARGTLSFTGHSGINNVVFTGRISRDNKLKPGRYELIVTAANSTGQRSTPVSLSFTITR
jgi:alpha-tubulin suppressor-like RCC1 family protein